MGANECTIKYANKAQYSGSVKDKIPEGKGKVTFKNGSTFEGQFKQGEPNNGKIRNGQFVYQGQMDKSQLNGNGMLIDKSNTFYEGMFEGGRFVNGEIIKKNKDNDEIVVFKGQVSNFSPLNGKGVMKILLQETQTQQYITSKRLLDGTFKNGNLDGQGKYTLPNGDTYQGLFVKGKANNQGQYKSKQFNISGDFVNNIPQGNSIIQFKNGDIFEGKLKDGQMHGRGKYIYSNGTTYEGDFYFGSLWGQCKIQYPKDSEVEKYEGEINDGHYNGIGVLYYSNGVIFKGYFLNGAKNGHGIYIYGKEKYKCLYLMNQLSGELKLIDL